MTDRRERLLETVQNLTESANKSDAIDLALLHYKQDFQNRKENVEKLTIEQWRLLETDAMKTAFYPKVRP